MYALALILRSHQKKLSIVRHKYELTLRFFQNVKDVHFLRNFILKTQFKILKIKPIVLYVIRELMK